MRKFLITILYINIILYLVFYSLTDYILREFPSLSISSGTITVLKIIFLIAAAFCLGVLISIFRNYRGARTVFDYRLFLKIGVLPFVLLLLSGGQITSFINTHLFGGSKQISELAFYLFSRDSVWAVWFGISIGVSVKLIFTKEKHSKTANFLKASH